MADWASLVTKASKQFDTPFFLFSWPEVITAIGELSILEGALPIRHWYSFKSSPVAPLVRRWVSRGGGLEVVSEYELQAALSEHCPPHNILINGVGKHGWLHRYNLPHLNVVFDSAREVSLLARHAKVNNWLVGFRINVLNERDPDEPEFSTQFGMSRDEVRTSANVASSNGLEVRLLHFHLRSNVYEASEYHDGLIEIGRIAHFARLHPEVIDFGGGLPVSGERSPSHLGSDREFDFELFRTVLSHVSSVLPSVGEIWLENGRFVTARSAVLVVKVREIKERMNTRFLICDGGRTNHALVSDWENHDLFVLPPRKGKATLTTICGPTCMAFDRLVRAQLPSDIRIGDHLVWKNAGAYHIPWETRFSGGLALVLFCDDEQVLSIARDRERFENWWAHWNKGVK